MSTLVMCKDPEVLFLGTDSRCVIGAVPVTDAQPKIFEITKRTFLATSGRMSACQAQVTRAREIAAEMDTTDVRVIAQALQRDMMPFLEGMAARLRMGGDVDPMTAAHLSGAALLHGAVICGTSQGTLGYVDQSYLFLGGALVCMAQEHFLPGREITCTTGATLELLTSTLSQAASEPGTWTEDAEVIARRLLTALVQANDASGGPDQILRLDANGAEWICEPPSAAVPVAENCVATVTALVSLISPAISGGTVSGATFLSTLNGVTTQINGATDPSLGLVSGLTVKQSNYGSGAFNRVVVHAGGMALFNNFNVKTLELATDGTIRAYDAGGNLRMILNESSAGRIQMFDLAGVERVWIDSDGFAGHIRVSGTGASILINGRSL